jgi:hypothetical protein
VRRYSVNITGKYENMEAVHNSTGEEIKSGKRKFGVVSSSSMTKLGADRVSPGEMELHSQPARGINVEYMDKVARARQRPRRWMREVLAVASSSYRCCQTLTRKAQEERATSTSCVIAEFGFNPIH